MLPVIVFLSLFHPIVSSKPPIFINVTNGGHLGEWGETENCPSGMTATGFSLKAQLTKKFWRDDTALNGIRLYCTKKRLGVWTSTTTITSTVGKSGDWSPQSSCSKGNLIQFQLNVEAKKGLFKDDTGANNIRFHCSDSSVLQGPGPEGGEWGQWSDSCPLGICGLKTRVEKRHLLKDGTGLNDVQFVCC
ncbi:vitelline membrane outer layer protein 1 homolog [Gastrophryne carolinensis]